MIHRTILSLLWAVLVATSGNAEDASKPLMQSGDLSEIHFPLYRKRGPVIVNQAPIVIYGRYPDNVVTSLCSPVYATSEEVRDRSIDINIISMFRIGAEIRFRNEEESFRNQECDLIIDLKHARQPEGCNVNLVDVVQYLITCLRLALPPNYPPKVNVKIVNGQDALTWKQFEGPLWSQSPSTENDKKAEKRDKNEESH